MGGILREYGAHQAMKLDGGSSTQLWYREELLIPPDDEVGGVANALLVFREEIPRHDAQLIEQSRWPIVKAGEPFSMTLTLRNVGFLPWEADLPYNLRHIEGERFGLNNRNGVPATVATGVDIEWIMQGLAPEKPGFYESQWQLAYEDTQGSEEVFGPILKQVVVVVPDDTPPDVTAGLRQLLDHYQELGREQLDLFLADLIAQGLQRIQDELLNLLPPELLCLQSLLGIGLLLYTPVALNRHSSNRKDGEND
jgi:hypothetical protein